MLSGKITTRLRVSFAALLLLGSAEGTVARADAPTAAPGMRTSPALLGPNRPPESSICALISTVQNKAGQAPVFAELAELRRRLPGLDGTNPGCAIPRPADFNLYWTAEYNLEDCRLANSAASEIEQKQDEEELRENIQRVSRGWWSFDGQRCKRVSPAESDAQVLQAAARSAGALGSLSTQAAAAANSRSVYSHSDSASGRNEISDVILAGPTPPPTAVAPGASLATPSVVDRASP